MGSLLYIGDNGDLGVRKTALLLIKNSLKLDVQNKALRIGAVYNEIHYNNRELKLT